MPEKLDGAAISMMASTAKVDLQKYDDVIPMPSSSPFYLQAVSVERVKQLVALFNQLDERGQVTTLALMATAAKLHPAKGNGNG